jgi:outer membrane lipoprotein SlyB
MVTSIMSKSRSLFPSALPTLLLASTLTGILLSGCGASRPVIYNGGTGANQDINDCMRLARQNGADAGKGASVARDTATGAAMGAAATGVYGAVRGYSDVGNRTAAGAAAGAAVGLIRGGVKASEPGATYKRYVNRCLSDRGHDVVGWN